MSYIERHLIPGEVLIYETRLHWVVMLGHFLFAALLAAAGGLLLYYGFRQTPADAALIGVARSVGWGLLGCTLLVILAGLLRRNATEMAVTNRRVVVKVGIVTRKTLEMLLAKVESVEVSESLTGRLLGYGTILIIGSGGTPEPFHRLAHPAEFRSQLQQQIEQLH